MIIAFLIIIQELLIHIKKKNASNGRDKQ